MESRRGRWGTWVSARGWLASQNRRQSGALGEVVRTQSSSETSERLLPLLWLLLLLLMVMRSLLLRHSAPKLHTVTISDIVSQ